jgi:hypothetical protein
MLNPKLVRRIIVPLVAAGAVAGASLGTADALTGHAAKPATETLYLGSINAPKTGLHDREEVVMTGPITAGGKDTSKGDKDTIHLRRGTILLIHPDKQSKFSAKINPKTCFARFTLTGPYTLKGTGGYAHVTGSGTYVGHGQGILPRGKSGSCSKRAEPAPELFTVKASGPIHGV